MNELPNDHPSERDTSVFGDARPAAEESITGGEGAVVARASTEFEARLKCIALRDAGIEAVLFRESRTASLDQAVTGKAGLYLVRVAVDDRKQAETTLREAAETGERFDQSQWDEQSYGDDQQIAGAGPTRRAVMSILARVLAWGVLALLCLTILAFLVVSLLDTFGMLR